MSDPLALLLQLLDVARASALWPDARRVTEWLSLVQRPWSGRTTPKLELHPVSGFPTRRSLARLLQRQRLARAFFAAHRARPPRGSDQFNAALAACDLWAPGTEAKVMTAARASSRLLVVHDRFDAKTGTLQRFSVQLGQKGSRHVKLERGTTGTCSTAFMLAVEDACSGDAAVAAVKLSALEGLEVYEVTKGELGPCVTAHAGLLADLQPQGDEAVLSLVLERIGESVTADHSADAWPPPGLVATPLKRSRERKLVCTPGFEAELKTRVAGSRMLIRSR